jgi:hypothetical protein
MTQIAVALIAAAGTILTTWMTLRASRNNPPAAPVSAPTATEPVVSPPPRVDPLDRVWRLFAELPPLGRSVRSWLAALLGFLFSGFGIALYFRKLPDVLIGIAFLVPLGLASSGGEDAPSGEETTIAWWYWIFAALAGIYGALRAESANRLAPPPES